MFDEIQFEISGKCNAKCKYCYTGRCNRVCNFGCIRSFVKTAKFKQRPEVVEKGQ